MSEIKKIIIHWTAGTGQPNLTDFQHYHYLVNEQGVIVKGKFPVSANEVCKTDINKNVLYAAHCGGGNTGAIGVALCGMYVPNGISVQKTKYPLTKLQCERMFKLVAELCKEYDIKITPQTVMTHYEFGMANPKTSSAGKIDIIYLPPYPEIKKDQVGGFIRNKVRWYFSKIS